MRDLKRHAHAESTELPSRSPAPASRWPVSAADLDIFWPILVAILVTAVIFVTLVAHMSMNAVGVRAVVTDSAQPPKPAGASKASTTVVIVQISSHPTRSEAMAAAQGLEGRGVEALVLNSDDYRPLNRGYFVVYAGPYPATPAGRAEAKRLQDRLDGALLREIRHR